MFGLEASPDARVEGTGVEEPLVGGCGLVVDPFLAAGGDLGPAGGFHAGQEMVLAGPDQVPQLVEQVQFGVGFVAVAEGVAAYPVAVALFDVGVCGCAGRAGCG